MAKLIANTYGDALFELAVENDQVDELFKEVQQLQPLLRRDGDFAKMMTHPKIDKDEKLQIAETVFKGRISQEMMGFLTIVIGKDRYPEIDAMLEYFISRVKEYRGIGIATVTTAVPLTAVQGQRVQDKLLATTKYKTMEIHFEQNPDLIGGMVIRIGDRVVDSSIRTKLSELQKELLKVQI